MPRTTTTTSCAVRFPVMAIACSSRSLAILVLDQRLRLLDFRSRYLRRARTAAQKIRAIRRHVQEALTERTPATILIEAPKSSAIDGRVSVTLTAAALAVASEVEPRTAYASFRAACVGITGHPGARHAALVLCDRYPALARRLVRKAGVDAGSPKLERDRRPLLGALAIAHAAALEHLKNHG